MISWFYMNFDNNTMNITLDNFEHHVPFKIWQRGMDYFEDGAVQELCEISSGKWIATVEGSSDYEVELSLDGRSVESWYCDCPYDGGDICKHVVAMVLAVRDEMGKQRKSAFSAKKNIDFVNSRSQDVTLEELIQQARPEDFQSFVMEKLMSNQELHDDLCAYLRIKYVSHFERDYAKEIENIFKKEHKSSRRYGHWNRCDDFDEMDWDTIFTKVRRLLDEVSALIKKGISTPAIDASIKFFQMLDKHHDDSLLYDDDSDVYAVCEIAESLIKEASRNLSVSAERKRKLLNELRELMASDVLQNYDYCDTNDLMIQVNLQIQNPDETLNLLDELLEEYHSSYNLYEFVLKKIHVLCSMGRQSDARKVISEYIHLPEIRVGEVEQLIVKHQYEQALQMLDEGIQIAQMGNYSETELKWLQMKVDIYEKMNDKFSLIMCYRQMFVREGGTLEYYHQLKKYVDASEWKSFLDELIKDTTSVSPYGMNEVLPDIYVEEKDDEHLYDYLCTSNYYNRLDLIRKYGLSLPDGYASSLLAVMVSDLRDYAEKNLGRNHYVKVAELLHYMKRFQGGKIVVKELVDEFRIKYKRRSAMIDELRRL